jgi:hypothetical protein
MYAYQGVAERRLSKAWHSPQASACRHVRGDIHLQVWLVKLGWIFTMRQFYASAQRGTDLSDVGVNP